MDLQRKITSLHTYKCSVTSAEKAFVNQRLVHDRGHFAKQLKKTAQRHEAKQLRVNGLHFLFDFFQFQHDFAMIRILPKFCKGLIISHIPQLIYRNLKKPNWTFVIDEEKENTSLITHTLTPLLL